MRFATIRSDGVEIAKAGHAKELVVHLQVVKDLPSSAPAAALQAITGPRGHELLDQIGPPIRIVRCRAR